MKTKIITLLICGIAPLVLTAQPMVATNEFYHAGDIINMTRCSTDVNAGASGASATWDFSGVGASGGIATTTVAANTNSQFVNANLMITLPDGSIEYMKENNTDSYVEAVVSPAGAIRNYNNYYFARRPERYNVTTIDTYRMVITSPSTVGTGIVTQGCDGYGTLKLPTGTFNYVLRVKRTITEKDSVDNSFSGFKNVISYMWFDTTHTAPLFRIDSSSDVTGTTVTAMYLSSPTAVKNVDAAIVGLRAYLDNNELLIAGNFERGKQYDVALNNIIGSRIVNGSFTAVGNTQRFDTNKQLAPGIYVVSVTDRNDPSSPTVIKVIKQ